MEIWKKEDIYVIWLIQNGLIFNQVDLKSKQEKNSKGCVKKIKKSFKLLSKSKFSLNY